MGKFAADFFPRWWSKTAENEKIFPKTTGEIWLNIVKALIQ